MPNPSELLGDSLIDSSFKKHDANQVIEGKKGFLLYFSASWCSPCKKFTPELASVYENALKEKGEVIFVSRDHDEESFNSYLQQMPWKAIPFHSPLTKSLQEMFEVSGIPALLSFDHEGNLLSKDGRVFITSDPSATNFPWKDASIIELIGDVVNSKGEITTSDELKGKSHLALLFTAKWCPVQEPLDGLKETYMAMMARGESTEFIYASKDRSEEEFNEYLGMMPWKAIPYHRMTDVTFLTKRLKISEIPSLVVIDCNTWRIVTSDGISAALEDPEGTSFPWELQLLSPLSDESLSLMGTHPLLVYVSSDSKNDAEDEAIINAVIAKKEEEWKNLESNPLYITFGNSKTDAGLIERVKEFFGFENENRFAVIINSDETLHTFSKEYSEENISNFIDDVLTGKSVGVQFG